MIIDSLTGDAISFFTSSFVDTVSVLFACVRPEAVEVDIFIFAFEVVNRTFKVLFTTDPLGTSIIFVAAVLFIETIEVDNDDVALVADVTVVDKPIAGVVATKSSIVVVVVVVVFVTMEDNVARVKRFELADTDCWFVVARADVDGDVGVGAVDVIVVDGLVVGAGVGFFVVLDEVEPRVVVVGCGDGGGVAAFVVGIVVVDCGTDNVVTGLLPTIHCNVTATE